MSVCFALFREQEARSKKQEARSKKQEARSGGSYWDGIAKGNELRRN